jgi:SAM-dependent methyltransferase
MDPVDPRQRFAGAASGYARFRPSYPDALVDRVLAESGARPGDRVADVGCGTGIFTRLLAARGLDAVGVDPNEDTPAVALRRPRPGGRARVPLPLGGARLPGGEGAARRGVISGG